MGFSNQCNQNGNSNYKRSSAHVFAKRKPAFKIRIDSLKSRSPPLSKSMTPTTATINRKKSVRFAEGRNTVLFRHVMDYELKESWYQSKDYSDFQMDSKITLDALQQAQGQLCRLDPQQHCIRGLEARVNDAILKLRQTRIRTNVQVVLDQQNSQRFHGIKDTNMLGAVSKMFSKQSRQHALSMGALDSSLVRGC